MKFTLPESLRKVGHLYCPGCGHGVAHRLLTAAVDELGIRERTIAIAPVGCAVFAYHYWDFDTSEAAHGRPPAVATGMKRVLPDRIVITYQGDGDLAAIGGNEMLHAANRGENITVIFINNACYGMTGGQMAPTTLFEQKTTTSPKGRTMEDGYPIRVCETLSNLEGVAYLERVALDKPANIMKAGAAIKKALKYQIEGKGFSLVECLSTCPTGWKMDPIKSSRWIGETMMKYFPLGIYKDKK